MRNDAYPFVLQKRSINHPIPSHNITPFETTRPVSLRTPTRPNYIILNRNPVIFSDYGSGVQSPPKRIVFRFHPNALGYFQHTYRGLPLQIPLRFNNIGVLMGPRLFFGYLLMRGRTKALHG